MMGEQEAMRAIADAFRKTMKMDEHEGPKITLDTDFIKEELLDSLDSMVFLMELSETTGKQFPTENQDVDLVELGFFRVRHLVKLLAT